MPKEESLPTRKKMRKGTHSCFECRRRKIRCIFPPDNPDVCSECFARGSRCIDQENANPDVIVDHRKNLRERVSRLEALVDSLLDDKTEKSHSDAGSTSRTPQVAHRDTFPPTPISSETSSSILQLQKPTQRATSERGHHVPILSAFEDALNDAEERIRALGPPPSGHKFSIPKPSASADDRYTITCKNPEDMNEGFSRSHQIKRERAKQALMSVLPSYEQLNRIMNSNGEWWQTWRQKCSGTSEQQQTLAQFAAKAFNETNIGAIGTVVLAVGVCSDEDDVERYIEAVDRWVLSDDEYAATLEGMECLILKAKWYADVGQPRRAWLANRKGLMYTQLMGLHRKRTTSAAYESIWWSLYHGDRFLSLLLGLPYGISDTHCDLALPETPGEYMAPLTFMNKVSMLAGKVIDRNQGVAEQSFAWALQLDQELEDLWKKLDPNWVEFSELMADIETNAADLRERLMAQIMYHQIRVYLHLPFMLKSQSNSRFTYSRTACLNGSREVLRLYQALRTGEVQPLYECKAVDFLGFTSAVLIQLGLFNFGITPGATTPKQQEDDVRQIEISIDIFRRASSEKGGKVALQSAEVLEKMLKKFKQDFCEPGLRNDDDFDDTCELVIPYFGTISFLRGGKPQMPPCPSSRATMLAHRQASRSQSQSTQGASNTPLKPSPQLSMNTQLTPQSDTTDLFGSASNANLTPQTAATSIDPHFSSNQQQHFSTDPFVSYDGFYNWGPSPNSNASPGNTAGGAGATTNSAGEPITAHVNDDSMTNFPLPTNNFSWQNMPMDIDQDWSWFLNDGGAQVGGTGAQGLGTVGEAFTQQGFVGF
ncbi:hypothetical protein BS50DRAFT_575587 [Corynespora cassiicola Philippines]|uniref:Zn(2)-C6 fungal-type domain-containing protein n=1 Tax=Corynespora cassiicola Philippines TaxID=1448308 RepID=A0A2T2NJS9_CORCC|nr:hypothetical protein BS50DRAFT_575587 [Corynespora cassiicola Philippines]